MAISIDDPVMYSDAAKAFMKEKGIDLRDRESTDDDLKALKVFMDNWGKKT
jgi:hypothetical protein